MVKRVPMCGDLVSKFKKGLGTPLYFYFLIYASKFDRPLPYHVIDDLVLLLRHLLEGTE